MSIRTERVARLVQREIASILLNDFSQEIPGLVTVTAARVTGDLSIAYVYVSVLSPTEEEKNAVFRHLESLTADIRVELASRIRHQVRKIPELRFFLDETQEQVARLEALFDDIRTEKEQRDARNGEN